MDTHEWEEVRQDYGFSKEQLDTLQWAKEFMDKYEKAREKTPKGGIRGEEGKLFSEVY